jgi:hypothetical protein
MSIDSAVARFSLQKAEKDIMADPSLSLWGKAKAMSALQNEANTPDKRTIGLADVVKGAVGAGIGYGVGTLMGKMFGVSQGTLSTFRNLGMGLGTLMNTGVLEMRKSGSDNTEQERRDAFRYGFAKGAVQKGLFSKKATLVANLHDVIGAPINAGIGLGNTLATNTGVLANQMAGMDQTDQDVTNMLLEQRELEQAGDRLESQRRARALKLILDKRRLKA